MDITYPTLEAIKAQSEQAKAKPKPQPVSDPRFNDQQFCDAAKVVLAYMDMPATRGNVRWLENICGFGVDWFGWAKSLLDPNLEQVSVNQLDSKGNAIMSNETRKPIRLSITRERLNKNPDTYKEIVE